MNMMVPLRFPNAKLYLVLTGRWSPTEASSPKRRALAIM